MWTEAHRARHEAGLKNMVTMLAVGQVAAWLEQADPPQSARALPTVAVVGAIAWHLRVGGPWRALPAGYPHWRTVYSWFRRWGEKDASEGIGDASERTFDREMPDWAASTSASSSMSAALSIMVVHHRGPPTQLKHSSVPRRG